MFFAYAVVTMDKAVLFTEASRLDAGALTALGKDVEIHAYDEFFAYLKALPEQLQLNKDSVRDGVALARYFAWLEEELVGGHEDQLEKYRSELAMFKSTGQYQITDADVVTELANDICDCGSR